MSRWQKIKSFVKEHPWESACLGLTGLLLLQTLNANRIAKVANKQADEVEKANQYMSWIVEAIEKGWDLAMSEDGMMIDIIPTDDSQPLQAV